MMSSASSPQEGQIGGTLPQPLLQSCYASMEAAISDVVLVSTLLLCVLSNCISLMQHTHSTYLQTVHTHINTEYASTHQEKHARISADGFACMLSRPVLCAILPVQPASIPLYQALSHTRNEIKLAPEDSAQHETFRMSTAARQM